MSILVVTASAARGGPVAVKRELSLTGGADHDFLEGSAGAAARRPVATGRLPSGRLGRIGRAARPPTNVDIALSRMT